MRCVRQIISKSKKLGAKYLLGEYISTTKNILVKDFYKKYGFKKVKFDDIGLDCNLIDTNKNMYIIPTKIKKIPFGDIYE